MAIAGRAWAPLPRRVAMGGFALGALAIAAPLMLADTSVPKPPAPVAGAPLPDVVAREQRPGEVAIVDFIDFECPYCRMLHGRLTAAIDQATKSGARVRVVRKMVPLVDKHPGALAAAIAWCCAEKQGKADAMAEALVAAPTDELTGEGCEKLAAKVGCDMDRYRKDAADPSTRARIDHDLADARAAGIRSLPTVYIGSTAFVGAAAQTDELLAAIR
jgi:protein-disulfide isomerase